ncbi:hypothetical protein [Rothia terrae]|uniref:Uncharacterized protein n=1 Tax=Rothia terrae TaxID=396015 RepID=A0A7H2BCR6_9MICC|nr:hypothetical protein [Rothia terrae]QNV37462.1 hypothetical protein IDM49_09585 [Rothia terrae]
MRKFSSVDRVLAGWAIGMCCAVVLALVSLDVINRLVYGPTGEVRAYFQALKDGDGSRALGILNASVPEKSGAAMLDGSALAASVDTLKDLELSTEEIDGDHATVRASYTLDGEAQSTDFPLHKVGSHWGVFDVWAMDDSELPTVEVTAPGVTGATLNNTKVSVPAGDRDFAVFYPGTYTSAYESALFSAQPQHTSVLNADDQKKKLKLSLKASEAATNSITSSVQQHLDACATQNTLYPAGCPFEYPFAGRVNGDVTWSVKKYPETQVSASKKGTWAYKDSAGTAHVSFTQIDLYTGKTSKVEKDVPFTYKADLDVDGDTVTVTPKIS